MLDAGVEEGRYFMAMEYLSGVPLSRLSGLIFEDPERFRGLSLRIVADAAAGLEAVHEARDPDSGTPLRIVHRDVAPSNLMVGEDGLTKLIDFGIARSAPPPSTPLQARFSVFARTPPTRRFRLRRVRSPSLSIPQSAHSCARSLAPQAPSRGAA